MTTQENDYTMTALSTIPTSIKKMGELAMARKTLVTPDKIIPWALEVYLAKCNFKANHFRLIHAINNIQLKLPPKLTKSNVLLAHRATWNAEIIFDVDIDPSVDQEIYSRLHLNVSGIDKKLPGIYTKTYNALLVIDANGKLELGDELLKIDNLTGPTTSDKPTGFSLVEKMGNVTKSVDSLIYVPANKELYVANMSKITNVNSIEFSPIHPPFMGSDQVKNRFAADKKLLDDGTISADEAIQIFESIYSQLLPNPSKKDAYYRYVKRMVQDIINQQWKSEKIVLTDELYKVAYYDLISRTTPVGEVEQTPKNVGKQPIGPPPTVPTQPPPGQQTPSLPEITKPEPAPEPKKPVLAQGLPEECQDLLKEEQRLARELAVCNAEKSQLTATLTTKETELQTLRAKIGELDRNLALVKTRMADLQINLDTLTTNNTALARDKDALNKQNQELNAIKAGLMTDKTLLATRISDLQQQVENLQKALNNTQPDIATYTALEKTLRDKIAALESELGNVRTSMATLKNTTQRSMAEKDARIQELTKEASAVTNLQNLLNVQTPQLKTANETIAQLNARIADLNKKLQQQAVVPPPVVVQPKPSPVIPPREEEEEIVEIENLDAFEKSMRVSVDTNNVYRTRSNDMLSQPAIITFASKDGRMATRFRFHKSVEIMFDTKGIKIDSERYRFYVDYLSAPVPINDVEIYNNINHTWDEITSPPLIPIEGTVTLSSANTGAEALSLAYSAVKKRLGDNYRISGDDGTLVMGFHVSSRDPNKMPGTVSISLLVIHDITI